MFGKIRKATEQSITFEENEVMDIFLQVWLRMAAWRMGTHGM